MAIKKLLSSENQQYDVGADAVNIAYNESNVSQEMTDIYNTAYNNKMNENDYATLASYHINSTNKDESTYTKTEVNSILNKFLKAAGSLTPNPETSKIDLNPSASILNNVYNITNNFIIDENFLEYNSQVAATYPAGTNIACVEIANEGSIVYKQNVMSSYIDTSIYQTKQLENPISITGQSPSTTVVGALNDLNQKTTKITNQAETNSLAPSYIKNKPNNIYTPDNDSIINNNGKYTAVANHIKTTSLKPVCNIEKIIPETQNGSQPYNFYGIFVQTDKNNIYYSKGNSRDGQKILNKSTNTQENKSQDNYSDFRGNKIQTDGNDIYYSSGDSQKILNRSTSTQEDKTQNENGMTSFHGDYIQTDGDNIYYSYSFGENIQQKVLNKFTSTQEDKTQNGYSDLIDLNGDDIQTDGNEIYYSEGGDSTHTTQKILNKFTNTQENKTQNGMTSFYGKYVQTDGKNFYYSKDSTQKVLNKSTSTQEDKTQNGLASFDGDCVQTEGENIYYSKQGTSYQIIT